MRVCVLIKEVPDMKRVKFDSEQGRVDRSSAKAEINPFDLNALQAAVNLKQLTGCEITAITMGPAKAEGSLRDAYARGADQCVLASDMKFSGSDTLATSSILAAVIKKTGPYDVIISGEKSVDGDTAQVGAEIAEFLGWGHCYYVNAITSLQNGKAQVETDELCGKKQIREMKLPALLSVTKNIDYPHLPDLKRKLASVTAEVRLIHAAALTDILPVERMGSKGSPTRVARIEVPEVKQRSDRIFRNDYPSFSACMKQLLVKEI